MRRVDADQAGIRTIADLTPRAADDARGDLSSRPAGMESHPRHVRAELSGTRTMDPSLMYQAVASKQVDVISAYSTDGRIAA